MVFIEIPSEEVIRQTKKVQEMAFELRSEAEKLALMCRARIDVEEKKAAGFNTNSEKS